MDCTNEYFDILDGPPSSAAFLGRICSGFYHTYQSSSSSVTIKYFRRFNNIGKVFIVYYYSEPKGERVASASAGSWPVRLGSSDYPIAALGPWAADSASAWLPLPPRVGMIR